MHAPRREGAAHAPGAKAAGSARGSVAVFIMTPLRKAPRAPITRPEPAASPNEAVALGPASYMLVHKTDAKGTLDYQVGTRKPIRLRLGERFASVPIGVIDSLRVTMLADPVSNRLIGVAGYPAGQLRIFLFGEGWGRWIDADGRDRPCSEDTLQMMRQLKMTVQVDPLALEVTLEFQINMYNREAFQPEVRRFFEPGPMRFSIGLTFSAPSGEFMYAKLNETHRDSGVRSTVSAFDAFPLLWPGRIEVGRAMENSNARTKPADDGVKDFVRKARGPVSGRYKVRPVPDGKARDETDRSETKKKKYKVQPRAKLKQSAAGAETSSRPYGMKFGAQTPKRPRRPTPEQPKKIPRKRKPAAVPRTDHLSVDDLLKTLRFTIDEDQRWKILEANLILARPERTYGLIANHAELIAERTPTWLPLRLRAVFRDQPGSVLIGIMERWHVNQVLSVAEDNSESEKIVQWLREREVDRLLRLDLDRSPRSNDDAREDLNIDRSADVQTVKRTWRTLLSYLNADLGRKDERAIHRKKDEIAKHLQEARNLLVRRLM